MNNLTIADPMQEGRQRNITTAGLVSMFRESATQLNQQSVQEFIEVTLGKPLGTDDLHAALKDGVVLCMMINKLRPGTIPRISKRPLPFLQMENISNFLDAAKTNFGLKSTELFQTVDLFEGKDMQRVHLTILSLARASSGFIVKQRLPQTRDEDVIIEPVPSVFNSTLSPPPSLQNMRRPSHNHSGNVNKVGNENNGVRITASSVTPPTTSSASQLKDAFSAFNNKGSKGTTPTGSANGSSNGKGSNLVFAHEKLNEILTLIEGDQQIQYQLGSCIGRGQFGAVYKALNLETGQVVAVKRIPLMDQGQEGVTELMKEVELLKSLSHPNIVHYEGFLCDSSALNIVLEFVEAGSLSSIIRQFGRMPEKLCVNYVIKMLEGLEYLHGMGVVHCDLKCANILTTKNGETKLSDFGVSKQLNVLDKDTKAVVGTPNWMAPEVIELSGTSTKSDIWSLGCTMIEMLTGKPPYWDMNPMTTLFRIVEDDGPPLPEGISTEMRAFLNRCFQKDISKRADATELLQDEWIKKGARALQGDRSNVMSASIRPQSAYSNLDVFHQPPPTLSISTPNDTVSSFVSETRSPSITLQSAPQLSPLSRPNVSRLSTPAVIAQPETTKAYQPSPINYRSSSPELHAAASPKKVVGSITSTIEVIPTPSSDNKIALENVARSLSPNTEERKPHNKSSLAIYSEPKEDESRNLKEECADAREVNECKSERAASPLPAAVQPNHIKNHSHGSNSKLGPAAGPARTLPNAVGSIKPTVPPSPSRRKHERGSFEFSSSSPEMRFNPFLEPGTTSTRLFDSNLSASAPTSPMSPLEAAKNIRLGSSPSSAPPIIKSKSPAAQYGTLKNPTGVVIPQQTDKGPPNSNTTVELPLAKTVSVPKDLGNTRANMEMAMLLAATGTQRTPSELTTMPKQMCIPETFEIPPSSTITSVTTRIKAINPPPISNFPDFARLLRSKSKSSTNLKMEDLICSSSSTSSDAGDSKRHSRVKSTKELNGGKNKARRGSLPHEIDNITRSESVSQLGRAATSRNEKKKIQSPETREFAGASSDADYDGQLTLSKSKHMKHFKRASSSGVGGGKDEKDCILM